MGKVCIFLYENIGSGIFFIMEGTPEGRRINFHTLKEIFQVAEERKTQYNYNILVSILEVYNEKIWDILATPTQQG